MLLFLSRGYFSSVNVLREVKATVVQEKKVTLVHEVDTNKGGAPIADMKAQCPNELREGVFGAVGAPREIISWLRVHDFQVVSLKSIVSQLLHSMPSFASAPRPPGVYLPSELEQSTFDFKRQVVVYTSQHNPGAREVVRELEELVVSSSGKSTRSVWNAQAFRVTDVTPKLVRRVTRASGLKRAASGVMGALSPHRRSEARPSSAWQPTSADWEPADVHATPVSAAAMKEQPPAPGSDEATHVLVYLNSKTFTSEPGSKFAAELRSAKQAGTPLVLVHENDPALGGCEFAKVMEHTPSDLIESGLYNSIAIALHPEPHRSVSHVLFLRAFGVKTDSRFSALTQRLTRRKKEENTVVKLSRRGSSAPGIESSSAP